MAADMPLSAVNGVVDIFIDLIKDISFEIHNGMVLQCFF